MLISVSARNFLKSRKGGVNFNFNFDLYRAAVGSIVIWTLQDLFIKY